MSAGEDRTYGAKIGTKFFTECGHPKVKCDGRYAGHLTIVRATPCYWIDNTGGWWRKSDGQAMPINKHHPCYMHQEPEPLVIVSSLRVYWWPMIDAMPKEEQEPARERVAQRHYEVWMKRGDEARAVAAKAVALAFLRGEDART